MMKVGITGGIASGKSTICQLFSDNDIDIIDADFIALQLVQPGQDCLNRVVQTFGSQVLLENGELNRPEMRQLIFSDSIAKQQLENILHPEIRRQLQTQSKYASSPYCILSIPLLIEADMLSLVDRVLVVDVDKKKQVERVCQRDNISLSQAQAIIDSQVSSSQRQAIADDIIINNTSKEKLTKEVAKLHKRYLEIANA